MSMPIPICLVAENTGNHKSRQKLASHVSSDLGWNVIVLLRCFAGNRLCLTY